MKKNNLNNLEQKLHNKLNEVSFGFDEQHWLEMEAKLKKPSFFAKYATSIKIAAVLLIGVIGLTYILNKDSNHIKVSEKITTPIKQKEKPITTEAIEKEETNLIANELKPVKETSINNESKNKTLEKVNLNNSNTKIETTTINTEAITVGTKHEEPEFSSIEGLEISGNICLWSTISLSAITDKTISSEKFTWTINGKSIKKSTPNIDLTIKESGHYIISIENVNGSESTEFYVQDSPTIDFTFEDLQSPYWDESAILKAEPVGLEYSWDIEGFDNPIIGNNQTVDFSSIGLYNVELIAIGKNGCATRINKSIHIQKDFDPLVPNVFTPDGDLLNDNFMPMGFANIEGFFKLSIFQLDQKLVYETNSTLEPWNGQENNLGKKLNKGTFIWKVEISNKERNKVFSGQVKNYAPTLGY
jgi:gliding motility-associated-like protein